MTEPGMMSRELARVATASIVWRAAREAFSPLSPSDGRRYTMARAAMYDAQEELAAAVEAYEQQHRLPEGRVT